VCASHQILIEHVIFRSIDTDCDIVPAAYDYDYSAVEHRALWLGESNPPSIRSVASGKLLTDGCSRRLWNEDG
jgi:hypothetical protein